MDVKALIKRHGNQHFASDKKQNAAVVKPFIRTLKTRILTYLSDHGTVSCVNVIQNLVNAYNHLRHRSIGMAPADVQIKVENHLWVRLFGAGYINLLNPLILQGAMVRASSHKTIFDKGYMPNWTKEHFTVSQAVPLTTQSKRRVNKLVNYNREALNGSWYAVELQEILDNQYRIEKVLRRRTLPEGTKELFNW